MDQLIFVSLLPLLLAGCFVETGSRSWHRHGELTPPKVVFTEYRTTGACNHNGHYCRWRRPPSRHYVPHDDDRHYHS